MDLLTRENAVSCIYQDKMQALTGTMRKERLMQAYGFAKMTLEPVAIDRFFEEFFRDRDRSFKRYDIFLRVGVAIGELDRENKFSFPAFK